MNILLILLGIIAFIIILILLILHIGIKIDINFKKTGPQLIGNLNINILKIKLIKKEYNSSKKNQEDKDKKKIDKSKEKEELNKYKDNETTKSTKEILNEIKKHLPLIKDLVKILLNYLIEIINEIKIKKVNSHLKLGLSSYTETAKIIGWIWTITVIPNNLIKAINLTAEPQFTEEIIDFEGEIQIEIKTLGALIKTLKLLFKKPIRQLIKEIIKYRKSNKKEKKQNTSKTKQRGIK